MDPVTFDYYKRLEASYSAQNITIIPDSKVTIDDDAWSSAIDNNDLFFVISLSDSTLETDRDDFCKNLAPVLKKTKGIVFAGNSLAYLSNTTYGCVFTTDFGLADEANNEQTGSAIEIVEEHPVTAGYQLKEYNLAQESTIYTIRIPENDGIALANAESYASVMIWEGLAYRAAVWGIKSSSLQCSGCLGWNIFDNLVAWTARTEDMGIKINFDKPFYSVGDTIKITVSSPVSVSSVTGQITYPDGKPYDLTFFGSDMSWNANYPLLKTDPSGEYTVSVTADDVTKTAKTRVKVFNMFVKALNRTDGVDIYVDVFDFSGNQLNVSLDIGITYPSGKKVVYGFVSNKTVYFNFNTTDEGNYTLLVTAVDNLNRTDYETSVFWVLIPKTLQVSLNPDSVAEALTAPATLNEVVNIENVGNVSITNISVIKTGDNTTTSWINILNKTLPDISVSNSSKLYFDIKVPVVSEGEYSAVVRISAREGIKDIPIQLTVKLSTTLSATPNFWSEYAPVGSKISKEFVLDNRGVVNLTVLGVNLEGTVADISHNIEKPSRIVAGTQEKIKISLDTSEVRLVGVSKKYTGEISIETNKLKKDIPVNVTVMKDLIKELLPIQSLLNEAETNVSKISQSTLAESNVQNDIQDAKELFASVRSLYQSGNYAEALAKFDSLKSKVDDIAFEVLRLQDVDREKNKIPQLTMNILIIAFVSIVIFVVVIWYVNRRRPASKRGAGEDPYSWLYRKYRK
jgi:hypothetical protein